MKKKRNQHMVHNRNEQESINGENCSGRDSRGSCLFMKTFMLLFAASFLLASCGEQTTRYSTPDNQQQTAERRDTFPNDFAKNNYWLMTNIVLNGNVTARFVFDNNSSPSDTLVTDKDFLESRKMIADKTPFSLNKFKKTPLHFSFGPFKGTEAEPATVAIPTSLENANGVIGLGFLLNKIIEVDFEHNVFLIDSTLAIDTATYHSLQLIHKGAGSYLDLPVTFYAKGKKIIRNCHFDLGCSGDGFVLGTGALSKTFPEIKPPQQIGEKGAVITTSMEKTQIVPFQFDSASLETQVILKDCPAYLLFANRGIAGSDMALFGLGVFRHYTKMYIDFRNNRLYVPKKDRQKMISLRLVCADTKRVKLFC